MSFETGSVTIDAPAKEPPSVEILVINAAERFGPIELRTEADEAAFDARSTLLGQIASSKLRPNVIYVSEACRASATLAPEVSAALSAYIVRLCSYRDVGDQKDRHQAALFVQPDYLSGDIGTLELAGRKSLQATLKIGQILCRGFFTHGYNQPLEMRNEQFRQLAEIVCGLEHAIVVGDLNTIAARTWQARLLHPFGPVFSTDVVEHLRHMLYTLEETYASSGLAGKIIRKINHTTDFVARVVQMAEGREGGVLQMLEAAGLESVSQYSLVTRRVHPSLPLGAQIDYGLKKGMGWSQVYPVPTGRLSDHEAMLIKIWASAPTRPSELSAYL